MNIIRARQAERLERIRIMAHSIYNSLKPDYEELWLHCAGNWGITRRYFDELLELAKVGAEKLRKENMNNFKKELPADEMAEVDKLLS